jgi:hypothetical protein
MTDTPPDEPAQPPITKTEREELRRLIRQQMKVLRSEVAQRKAEQFAEVDGAILARFTSIDEARQALNDELADMVAAWDKELRQFVRGRNEDTGLIEGMARLDVPTIKWASDRRALLRQAAQSNIEKDIKGALLRLERQEADLMRTLAVGALSTGAAQEFVLAIPTVGELVPTARLAELEASLQTDDSELLADPDDPEDPPRYLGGGPGRGW